MTDKTGREVTRKRANRQASDTPTGTVTFLFTDIEGSTVLWENHPAQMQDALARHDEILRAAVEASGGYLFKTIGDACCAAFATPRQALEATLAAQRALYAEPWDEDVEVRVRMALHTGVAEERDGDYFGPPVNRVARLLSTGHGGQILLSAVSYGLVRDALVHLEPEAELRDLGEHRLKDLRYTEHIFQLSVPDLPADFAPLKTHGLVTPAHQLATPDVPSLRKEHLRREAGSGDDRYRRIRPMGSGGMAEVYLAHDEVLDRDVALKVLRKQYADDEQFVERFEREARSAGSLSHPNIVAVHDLGETDDGAYYIVMECMPGGTLKERIVKEGALSPSEAIQVTSQIAQALQVAHRRELVHRDIKPQNVLLNESGEAKVADFGIARAASSTTITRAGGMLGTPHYVSPEVGQGEPATPQSDLYSLGVVLYEMLTGELPYDAETPVGVVMKHVSAPLRPPKEIVPDLPDGINAVCVRLLAKDPKDRYRSAAELLEDLEQVGRGGLPAAIAGQWGVNGDHTVLEDEVGTIPEAPEGGRQVHDGEHTPVGPPGGLSAGRELRQDREQASRTDRRTFAGREEARVSGATQATPGRRRRVLLLAGLVGLLLVLTGGVAMALTGTGPGASLLRAMSPSPASEDPPAQSPGVQEEGAAEDDSAEEKEPSESSGSDEASDSSGTSGGSNGASSSSGSSGSGGSESFAKELEKAVEDYYAAVDRQDWDFTYDLLDSETRKRFSKTEWEQKNQYFADHSPLEGTSTEIVGDADNPPVLVTLAQTFEDGTTNSRNTYFVDEDGSWKHRFSDEELDLFMADASFEEFRKAQEGDSSKGSGKTASNNTQEQAAVEKAVRDHYGAIGARDFARAYSYFGPTMRSTTDRDTWIEGEKQSQVTGSTINSLKVEKVSGNTATATVDVSFKDKTGTPRFLLNWNLVKEGGSWKLDSQESGGRVN